jgi:hypothetical protein
MFAPLILYVLHILADRGSPSSSSYRLQLSDTQPHSLDPTPPEIQLHRLTLARPL